MKKLFLLSFLTIISLSAISQQYGWTDISTNIPDSPDLSDVFFVSEQEGWITSSSQAEIYHTTDGAASFSTQTTSLGATTAIHMLDGNNGFSGGQGGWVYNTSDGGLNWNILATMGDLLDISFPFNADTNNPIGYACGNAGRVWEITSSTLADLNSPSASDFGGISAPSVNNVWVCGGGRIYYYNGTYFTSQIAPGGTFNDIHFINDQEGWVVGNSGVIGYTTNGGNTWNTQTNPDPQALALYSVFFLDADNGWAVGNGGIILQTIDGGNIWTIGGAGLTTAFLNGVCFTSPSNGYVVGNERTLLKYGELIGIADNGLKDLDFEVHPNPCQDKLSIRNLKSELRNLKFELIDITGRVVLSLELQGQENTIDVNDFPEGIYLVKLQTNEAVGVRKIIIK